MFGYAKIFQQIFDSSIANDWQVRHVFEDLLILANSDGVVDMTHDAISRRTNTPLEIVTRAIAELEKPDPQSRSDSEGGARLKRLDDHRTWGWWIVNHSRYRAISSDDQYREKTRVRVRKFRASNSNDNTVTLRNATVTHVTPSRSIKQIAEAGTKTEKNGAFAPDFVEEIYAAYPLKVGKPKALAAIQKQLHSTPPEKLLELTKAYAKTRNGNLEFVPHPSTWFNQQRFNDDPSTWKPRDGSTGRKGFDRNAGTANEGRASEYNLSSINARKVRASIPDSQRPQT